MRTDLLRGVAAVAVACLLVACSADSADECGPDESCAAPPTAPASSPKAASPAAIDLTRPEVIATGLEAPWGIAFLPNGDALVSERDSTRVVRVPARGGAPEQVMRLEQAQPRGEGGLLGLAVSPSYDKDGWVYAYLTAEDDNRVVRFRLGGRPEPVLTGLPKGVVHNGGRLAFGPDGLLYVGTGDTGDEQLSQDRRSLGGKILRLLPGDPPEIYSSGHRNVQGLAFDARGRLLATEFGQNRFDEVNIVALGDNGGWPQVEGRGTDGGRFLEPFVTWSTDEASPSGAAVLGDDLWVAALRGERLWRVPLDGSAPQPLFVGTYGRLRAAAAAPDGSLWLLTSNRDGRGDPVRTDDRIVRIPPSTTGASARPSAAPSPSATMTP